MDMYHGQPVLVKSSQVCDIHSNGDYRQAMDKLSVFSDILIVDLDGAYGEIIQNLARKSHIFIGGGLRTINDIQEMLKSSIRRCVIASAEDTLISNTPKGRLVVEMSINEHNEILTDGRQTNTHLNVIPRINQLVQIGIHTISITFVQSEGHLAGIRRQQIRDLLLQTSNSIRKIYIAGGISLVIFSCYSPTWIDHMEKSIGHRQYI